MNNEVTKRTALLVTTTSAFLTPFMGSAVNVALPSIGRDLALDAISLGWVATSYLLAAAMFLLPFGRWADIHGRKKTFLAGLVVYAVGSLLSGLSPSAVFLFGFRVLQGIGGSMIFGTGIAILTSVFPVGERGKVLGINVAAVYSGLAFGPFLGGVLTEHLGWRSVFLVNAPIALGAAVFAAAKLKGEWAETMEEKFDFVGAVLYSLSLVALMYGLSRLPATSGAFPVLGGVAGLSVFTIWESRLRGPLLDVNLLARNPVFAFSNLAALINYSSTAAASFLLSLYLQELKGLSPRHAGTILLAQPVVQAIFSPFAGRLSDRMEPRVIASTGMALTAVGLALFNFVGENTSLEFVVACLVLLGVGFALFSSPNTNAVMSSVDKRLYGVASGTLGTMRLTGQMLSMGIVMLMLSVYVGKAQITPQYHTPFLHSAKVSFMLFAALCAGGVFASLARGKIR